MSNGVRVGGGVRMGGGKRVGWAVGGVRVGGGMLPYSGQTCTCISGETTCCLGAGTRHFVPVISFLDFRSCIFVPVISFPATFRSHDISFLDISFPRHFVPGILVPGHFVPISLLLTPITTLFGLFLIYGVNLKLHTHTYTHFE